MAGERNPSAKYPRILLKLSGEALAGQAGFGLDQSMLRFVADEIAGARRLGVQLALVVGGGNFIRGGQLSALGFDRVAGDRMGMLATVLNALAVAQSCSAQGVPALTLSAFAIQGLVEPYRREIACEALEQGKVVVLAGGTGNPFFSTDTAAALRAAELGAGALLKATKVDGVYDRDPLKDRSARRFERLTYGQVLEQSLGVMDLTAITLCRENALPVVVFNVHHQGALEGVLRGEMLGTTIEA